MKKQLLSLSVLTAFLSMSAFAAGPVANIQVTGDIKPPTCTVNGATQNDVIFDLGKISPSLIPSSEPYLYPKGLAENTVNINCDAETYLAFNAIDTYATSELVLPSVITGNKNSVVFHLVDTNDTTKSVGGIFFYWKNVQVDGENAFISRANDANSDASAGSDLLITTATNGWTKSKQTVVAINELDLISGKMFSATFATPTNVTAYPTFLLSEQELSNKNIDITNGLDFMGEAVLTFKFGV